MLKRVRAKDDKLGVLDFIVLTCSLEEAGLAGTWADPLIRRVSGNAMNDALHGYILSLMKEWGPEPKYLTKKINSEDGWCSLYGQDCMGSSPSCRPGPTMPECWDAADNEVLGEIVRYWKEGLRVLVVVGDEFV